MAAIVAADWVYLWFCLWLKSECKGGAKEEVIQLHMTSSASAFAGRAFCEERHLSPPRLLCTGKLKQLVYCVFCSSLPC